MDGYFEPKLTEPIYGDTSESYEDDSEVEIILTKPPLKKVEQQRTASPQTRPSWECARKSWAR